MNSNFTSVMESGASSVREAFDTVVGYRFHPRDDELVDYYLRRKILGEDARDDSLDEVRIYCFDPWELLRRSEKVSDEWVFYCFCPRDYKYANSKRSNRTTKNGFWKPTGKVREVKGKRTKKKIGTKKTLVFYRKNKDSPKGIITQYVMHEYEYMAEPHSPDKEMFTLCKLKRKRDKSAKKMPKKVNHQAIGNGVVEQTAPNSDVETTNFSYEAKCLEASNFGGQLSPLPLGEGCSSIEQITCDSSVISDYGNQMSPPMEKFEGYDAFGQESCEYSETNCLKISDLVGPVTPSEETNSYQLDSQVAWKFSKASCLMTSDLWSHVSPLEEEGCLTPSTLESRSAFQNDELSQVVDSAIQKRAEIPAIGASDWNDLVNRLLPTIDPTLVDLMTNY